MSFDFEQRINNDWEARVNTMPAPLVEWIYSKNAEIDTLINRDTGYNVDDLESCERQREAEIERLLFEEEVRYCEPANYICYGDQLTVGGLLTMLHMIVTNDPSAAFKPIFHETTLKSWLR